MATDVKSLTKGWISFLKNNQIAELKSGDDGKLKYRKPVTSADLARYLEDSTDFGEDAISKAIHMVLAKKTINKQAPKIQHTPPEQEPNKQIGGPAQVKQLGSNVPVAPKKKYNNTDATDVDFRDVNEAIEDPSGSTVDEDDVESVFKILSSPAPAAAPATTPPAQQGSPAPDETAIQNKKNEELNQLKRMIRDTMSDSQRKALWRALTNA